MDLYAFSLALSLLLCLSLSLSLAVSLLSHEVLSKCSLLHQQWPVCVVIWLAYFYWTSPFFSYSDIHQSLLLLQIVPYMVNTVSTFECVKLRGVLVIYCY